MQLSILTPRGPVLSREVDEVTAPGVAGEFGVLPGHVPFISATKTGVLSYRGGGEHGKVAVGPGFVEVLGQEVSVLVQRAVLGSEVDSGAAEQLRREATVQAEVEWAEAMLAAR